MNMHQQRAFELTAAKAILQCAQAEARTLTFGEKSRANAHLKAVEDLDIDIKAANESQARFQQIANLSPEAVGLGEPMFTDQVKAGFVNAARTKGSFGATVSIKAALLGSGLPTSGTTVSPMPPGLGAFALRSLFTPAEALSPNVRYYRIGAGTGAAVVAEGALKPDSGVTSTAVDASLIKIASTFQVSDELAEDASFLMAALGQEVIRGTLVRENQQIVTALSGASGIFTGTGAVADALDVVATAVGAAEARDGITPGALVANPVDVAAMRKAKGTGGSYHIDPLSSAPSAVHGVPLAISAAVAAGSMLLVTQGAGVFYTRGGVRVESGYNADDWSKNLMTVRVEERVLPAIVRPSLVTLITLTA